MQRVMTPGVVFRSVMLLVVASTVTFPQFLVSQDNSHLGRIAVLRAKNTNVTPSNEAVLREFSSDLNSALAATKTFDVPDNGAIQSALKDEGIKTDELIDVGDYLDVGKALKADYIIIGSVSQKMLTLYSHMRIYSVADKSLKGVVSEDASIQSVPALIDLIAHRVVGMLAGPVAVDTTYASFQWSQELRFAFGPERVDLQPPVVYSVNNNPPFEISVKVNMERVVTTIAVTNFEIFVDNEVIASIDPSIIPPRTLREKKFVIGGHRFCFQAEVKELRVIYRRGIATVLIELTARYCGEK